MLRTAPGAVISGPSSPEPSHGFMPKRISKKLRDPNQIAAALTALSVEDTPRDPALLSEIMAEMGRKGGRIGGKRRLKTTTPEARGSSASKAAQARWAKKRQPSDLSFY